MKKTLLILLLTAVYGHIYAQDFPYGKVTMDELQMSKYDKDTSAHAVVLQEYGNSKLDADRDDRTMLTFEYHVKIKIFDSRAFNWGSADLRLIGNENIHEEIDNIKGTTSYIDDDGTVKTTNLTPDMIFNIKGKYFVNQVKFALPSLRKGCVIEYQYRLTTPYWTNFRAWPFQSAIPKQYSRYETHIPGFWDFNAILRGPIRNIQQTVDLEPNCYLSRGARADCSHHVYTLTDIPAFVTEEYMTAPKNFFSAIYYELASRTNPYTGAKTQLTKSWEDVDKELKDSKYFGTQLDETRMLKKRIAPVIAGKTTELEKAKAIYEYVGRSIKWNNHQSIFSFEGIEHALDKHEGTAGDINLTLITALNAAGINTEAVLLSTRNNGVLNKIFPTIEEFDLVIAKANIGGKSYFLDASENYLPFGMLTLKCLNGDGRVISTDKPSYWLPIEPNEKKNSTYTLDLTLQTDGKITGTMTHYAVGYEAYQLRLAIKKFNNIDEYVDKRDKNLSRIKIIKSEITGVDSVDMPITETYQIELAASKNMNANQLTFNPILFERFVNNPFKLAERTYPVNMGMPSDRRLVVTMHLPEQYEVSPPQAVNLTMPGKGGVFITSFQSIEHTFTFSDIISFNKSTYEPDEYPYLKEFYNKIIATEKSNLVIKKKL